ncbi:hypothetical protein HX773_19145 [Pantoea sp. B9002]|uniref:hypothetical protein n=1 Tax=Pantoea sp. B9002 TaxID=2726979 RepID=UPI0015A0F8D5|nr:hypothetical protein [Pantoea sp. B9002]NWA63026.1 hypothetical protein [Pantoea sp. B9002]
MKRYPLLVKYTRKSEDEMARDCMRDMTIGKEYMAYSSIQNLNPESFITIPDDDKGERVCVQLSDGLEIISKGATHD